jgi:hypothetical protein
MARKENQGENVLRPGTRVWLNGQASRACLVRDNRGQTPSAFRCGVPTAFLVRYLTQDPFIEDKDIVLAGCDCDQAAGCRTR